MTSLAYIAVSDSKPLKRFMSATCADFQIEREGMWKPVRAKPRGTGVLPQHPSRTETLYFMAMPARVSLVDTCVREEIGQEGENSSSLEA